MAPKSLHRGFLEEEGLKQVRGKSMKTRDWEGVS